MLAMDVYIGGVLELSVLTESPITPQVAMVLADNSVLFGGMPDDGFDELRHLDRNLYTSEITDYALFLKEGRVAGKSQGSLGSPGW